MSRELSGFLSLSIPTLRVLRQEAFRAVELPKGTLFENLAVLRFTKLA